MRYLFNGIEMDTASMEMSRGGRPLAVEPQVFDLLRVLIQNRERVVTRDDLMASVWEGRIVSETTISARINAARRLVGDTGARQGVIKTVARRGYRFVASIDECPTGGEVCPSASATDRAWYKGIEIPANDAERVAALRSYKILDTDPEIEYDDITVVAATSTGCRYAYISFCDDKRFWLKSKYGYPATFTERPRELSLCPPTILQSDLLMIRDMSQHPRYAHLPSVVNPPGTRFYCAMPLINPEGFALGTLCVWDPEPKELGPEQQECIRRLAREVLAHLECRRRILTLVEEKIELQATAAAAQVAKERTESLLHNMFPSSIASSVVAGKAYGPQFYAMATVMLLDFENFADLTRSAEPRMLVEQLDHYFSAFDKIVEEHGLQKIKTMGDTYLCVAGLPEVTRDHAIRACGAALAINSTMDRANAERRRLSLQEWRPRIVVHTGSMVAALIGEKRTTFDVWGAAPNVARSLIRECRTCEVTITAAVLGLIAKRYSVEDRGFADIDKVGPVKLYRLTRCVGQ
jgi:adenylate cyclase